MPEELHFPTLDELTAEIQLISERSALARLTVIGASRLGEPLIMLSIGAGDNHALVLGGPHANEPVGFLTILELARRLADTPELTEGHNYTWHLVPCIDPDAARFNESWYTAELTIRSYHRNFYRPCLSQQPEWMFPTNSRDPSLDHLFPETQALMRIIDNWRPRFLCSLHNADTGGAFFVFSRAAPELAATLSAVPARHGITTAIQPADCIGWPCPVPGVWVLPEVESAIPDYTDDARPPRHGASSAHYAADHGTLSIWPEVPMWREGGPGSPLGDRPEVRRSAIDHVSSAMDLLEDSLGRITGALTVPTPFRAAVADTIRSGRTLAQTWRAADESSIMPEAHDDMAILAQCVPLRGIGMLLRQLDVEYAAGNHRPPIRAERARLNGQFDEWCTRLEAAALTPIPLRDLVAVQVETALAAAAYCIA